MDASRAATGMLEVLATSAVLFMIDSSTPLISTFSYRHLKHDLVVSVFLCLHRYNSTVTISDNIIFSFCTGACYVIYLKLEINFILKQLTARTERELFSTFVLKQFLHRPFCPLCEHMPRSKPWRLER